MKRAMMTKKEEIAFVKRTGFCPYLGECVGSVDCNGKVYEFCRCRARDVDPSSLLPKTKEKVRFT